MLKNDSTTASTKLAVKKIAEEFYIFKLVFTPGPASKRTLSKIRKAYKELNIDACGKLDPFKAIIEAPKGVEADRILGMIKRKDLVTLSISSLMVRHTKE